MTPFLHRRRLEDQNTSFLLRSFEEFYLRLIDYQTKILDIAVSSEAIVDLQPRDISNDLRQFLEGLSAKAIQNGSEYTSGSFREAMYVMAALADEFFITMNWEGRREWSNYLLESYLFGSHDAGDLFFRNLEDFLRKRDPLRVDLAEVYLMALGLGFQGKYRNASDQSRLQVYRNQLYAFIYHHEPPKDMAEQRLFPEVYGYTLESGKPTYLQDIRQWIIGSIVVFSFLLLLSIAE
ncbi:MAG: DotU family type IV/VI secretion system protein [Janthinobacterium lividum]